MVALVSAFPDRPRLVDFLPGGKHEKPGLTPRGKPREAGQTGIEAFPGVTAAFPERLRSGSENALNPEGGRQHAPRSSGKRPSAETRAEILHVVRRIEATCPPRPTRHRGFPPWCSAPCSAAAGSCWPQSPTSADDSQSHRLTRERGFPSGGSPPQDALAVLRCQAWRSGCLLVAPGQAPETVALVGGSGPVAEGSREALMDHLASQPETPPMP